MKRSVLVRLTPEDAVVVRQALSHCAAERRIAAAREIDREACTVMGGQASAYERIAAVFPPGPPVRRRRSSSAYA